MKIEKPNFHVVTGGPGAGKTTLIEALSARGFGSVEEAGRRIIREQARTGGNATHDGDRLAFRALMLTHAIDAYHAAKGMQRPVFFDRGLPDLVGYSRLIGAEVPPRLEEAVARHRYNGTVFIAPPWAEIYGNDAERKQDFAEAAATHDAIRAAYQKAGYTLAELPKASVEVRVRFVLARIGVQAERRAR
ncbi:MAG: AAA family ATPase [Parvibaculum sp.]|uniref:AAA family ATPase n=1 Tax=Parvibaculum sp. TaxID=2024848 RepID=UPI00271A67B8|nr:AAA family ATPase [Parvibaculum sp.]MDO8840598.1 AAA family ATPase [Parvibaculum sp.]